MIIHYAPRSITACGAWCSPWPKTREPKKVTCKKCLKSHVFRKDINALKMEERNSEQRVAEKIKEMDGSNG